MVFGLENELYCRFGKSSLRRIGAPSKVSCLAFWMISSLKRDRIPMLEKDDKEDKKCQWFVHTI